MRYIYVVIYLGSENTDDIILDMCPMHGESFHVFLHELEGSSQTSNYINLISSVWPALHGPLYTQTYLRIKNICINNSVHAVCNSVHAGSERLTLTWTHAGVVVITTTPALICELIITFLKSACKGVLTTQAVLYVGGKLGHNASL